MLSQLRRLLVPIFAVSLTAGGLAYAAVETSANLDVTADQTADEVSVPTPDLGDVGDLDPSDDVVGELDGTVAPTDSPEAPVERSTEGCPEGFTGNHGQYVSGTEDRPRNEAAQSPCGKPVNAVEDGSDDQGDDAGEVEETETETDDDDAVETESDGSGQAHGNQGHHGQPEDSD